MSKHTPGEWFVGDMNLDYGLGPPGEIAINSRISAGQIGPRGKPALMDGEISVAVALPYGGEGDAFPEMTAANAALIAAAPDLLAACRSMLKTCGSSADWNGETHQSLLLIEAAVAKAEPPA